MLIFRRIFLSNYWWQKLIFGHKLHIGTQYRGKRFWPIRFLHPVCRRVGVFSSQFMFVTGQNTVCYDQVYDLFLVRTLYVMTKFMICYWSVHCMLRSTLWFVTGQNTVRYDQVYDLLLVSTLYVTTILVYDLLLVRTLYVMTKFMICYWSERCMLRPSLWFVTGQNTVCYDQVYDLLLVTTLYVTTKLMICYWSERHVNDQVWVLLLVRMPYVTTKPTICFWSEHCMLR